MNVLVDTSVWSLALRRAKPHEHPARLELEQLIIDGRAEIIGPIRQEILSGVRSAAQFVKLRDGLRAFPDVTLSAEDHEEAARYFNLCRAKGIQGSNTDFLICSTAVRAKLSILTTDADFERFAEVLPISLHRY